MGNPVGKYGNIFLRHPDVLCNPNLIDEMQVNNS